LLFEVDEAARAPGSDGHFPIKKMFPLGKRAA
jgi:hypothetical protein